jgi:hypothetical protein
MPLYGAAKLATHSSQSILRKLCISLSVPYAGIHRWKIVAGSIVFWAFSWPMPEWTSIIPFSKMARIEARPYGKGGMRINRQIAIDEAYPLTT